MESLKQMRFKEVKNEQKHLRVTGIHPDDLMREHVNDSFIPGESSFNDISNGKLQANEGTEGSSDEDISIDFV